MKRLASELVFLAETVALVAYVVTVCPVLPL